MSVGRIRPDLDLSSWTGRVTLALALLVAAMGSYFVWDAKRPPPIEPTLATFPDADSNGDHVRLLLAALEDRDTLDGVVAALRSDDVAVRLGALRMLYVVQHRHRDGTRDVTPLIREVALDPAQDDRLRGEALHWGIMLHAFRAPDDVGRLRAIASGPEDWARSNAFRALGSLGDAGMTVLLEYLESGDPLIRDEACLGLGSMRGGAARALPALSLHLSDGERRVRLQATAAIEQIEPGFDFQGRASHLGDAGGDDEERETLRSMRSLGLDGTGNPSQAGPDRR